MPQTEAQGDGLAEAAHVGPRTPCRIGSSAAQRSPFFATCHPTTSEAQWSTAAKNQHQPSAFVQNRDASVPQSSSGRSVRIRPLWLRSPRGCPRRTGASNPCALISRSTRFLPTRIPLAARRALTFRWPSPRNGLAFSTIRISCTSSSSLSAVFGPRFSWRSGLDLLPADLRPQRIHARACDPPRLAHHRQRVGPIRRRTHPPERFKSFRSSSPHPLFFQELRLQLDPHGHLSQLRPGSHQLPARPVLPLQALLAPVKEHAPPPLQRSGGATRTSRLTSPMSSPRRSRNTTSAFRCALHRFGRPSGLPRLLARSCSFDLRDIQCLLPLGPRDVG